MFMRSWPPSMAAMEWCVVTQTNWPAYVNAAVRIGRGPEFQAQGEVGREFLRGVELLNLPAFGRRRDNQPAVLRHEASIGTARLAVEADRIGDEGPRRRVRVAGLPAFGGLHVRVGSGTEAPAGQVASVEKAHETRLRGELIRVGFEKAERRENRTQSRGPFRVARLIGMEQVWKFFRHRVALGVGEERPGFDGRDLRVAFHRCGIELVQFLDFSRRPLLGFRTGKDLAEHDGHFRVVSFQFGKDELQVRRDGFRVGLLFEIVRADEQHDCLRAQREHVFLEPEQNAARGVAADPAIGHLHAGKAAAEIVTPALRDRIAEQHDRVLIPIRARGPGGATFRPQLAKPLVTADRPGARQAVVRGRDLKARVRRRRGGSFLLRVMRQRTGGEQDDDEGKMFQSSRIHRVMHRLITRAPADVNATFVEATHNPRFQSDVDASIPENIMLRVTESMLS